MSVKTDMAAYLFHEGTNYESYAYMGCHVKKRDDTFVYTFRTWAPCADLVSVVGDFLDWSNGMPMVKITEGGIWELVYFSPTSLEGNAYKFRIVTKDGTIKLKGDPYARYSRGSDDGASIVCHPSDFSWKDDAWLRYRKKQIKTSKKGHYLATPINIYELHLPSVFRHEDNSYFSYVELADKLIPYLKRMGYTHIEIMPITEYPFDPSWGYQVCCYFAPTARLGTTDDLRYFVNQMHQNGIGVIMDWVPAHFPKDEWGLFEFDGSKLYEYQGVDRMESHSWGTRFFDLGRQEVQSFLISSAVFWLKEYHFDGLRVDAVASMLYLDFDRMPGEWIPNEHGGKENLEAIAFLKKLNSAVFGVAQDVLMIAEESTSFPMITRPVADGGLGFNLKWNMGWANDFYHYLSLDPAYRKYHHQALNFPIMYAFSENYVLPISHDEVVYGKKSFLNKMHGTNEAKFLQFRAALLLMMTFPGKKMMFMGTEYGQFAEWNFEKELEWFMLDFPLHKTLLQYVMELNRFYLSHKELWEIDFSSDGFSWVLADDADHNLVAYRRFDEKGRELLIAVTFSGATVGGIKIPFPRGHQYELIFETTPGAVSYQYKTDMTGRVSSMECTLSPFSGAVWAAKDKRGEPLSKPVID